ncbi:cytochrome B5-like protein isoform X1 [Typha angustifolia]|uniref:cytochrome B5-like protein isoform X1 n=1 Tax=Typha angustifolia TaxID=59011 RepID=UPI003C2ED9DB
MEIVVIITLIFLIALGALFIIPRSRNRSKAKGTRSNVDGKILRTYTKEEVTLHRTRKDCWIIIKGKIYDVTPYVEEHPGGDAILNNAGGDSTEGFYGPQHATRVFDIVDEFYIGDLKS